MARVAVPQALALGSDGERAPEERLEGVVPDGIINRVLQHRRDAREVPSQLGDFRRRNSGEMCHHIDIAALHGGAVQNDKVLGEIAPLPGRNARELLREYNGDTSCKRSIKHALSVRRVAARLEAERRAHHRPAQAGHAAHAADPRTIVRRAALARVRRFTDRGDLRPEMRERAVAVAADVRS